jgi:hypothetical protein
MKDPNPVLVRALCSEELDDWLDHNSPGYSWTRKTVVRWIDDDDDVRVAVTLKVPTEEIAMIIKLRFGV